jgi:hypothetical protein
MGERCVRDFGCGNLRGERGREGERESLEDLAVGGRIILKLSSRIG